MRFNLFACSLIVAMSSAISVETLLYDDAEFTTMAAQVDSTAEWMANGKNERQYWRPADNCCKLYQRHDDKLKGYVKRYEEICWDKEKNKGGEVSGVEKTFDEGIVALDCGKNTWIELYNAPKHKKRLSLAGK